MQWHHFFFPKRVLKCQLLVGKLPWKIVSEWAFPFRPPSLFHLHSLGPYCHYVLDQVRCHNVNVAFQSSEKLEIELCSVSGSRLRGHRLEWHSVWRPSLLWQLRWHFGKYIFFPKNDLSSLQTQSMQTQQTLPPVSYTKAIDVWLATCVVFVFLRF